MEAGGVAMLADKGVRRLAETGLFCGKARVSRVRSAFRASFLFDEFAKRKTDFHECEGVRWIGGGEGTMFERNGEEGMGSDRKERTEDILIFRFLDKLGYHRLFFFFLACADNGIQELKL
jgi:hypothetical protein